MIHELEQAFIEGIPSDQQRGCIAAVFENNNDLWIELGVLEGPQDGSDQETKAMIEYLLFSGRFELSERIKAMLNDWLTDGF